MKKIIGLSLALAVVIVSASACSLKKSEVKDQQVQENKQVQENQQTQENIQESLEQPIVESSNQDLEVSNVIENKEKCGLKPVKISTLKVGDFYNTHKIKEISGNGLEKKCENSCPDDGVGLEISFDGEETVSGTLIYTEFALPWSFIPDDKTWTPYISVDNNHGSGSSIGSFVLKGLTCTDSFYISDGLDSSTLSKLPGMQDFLANARAAELNGKYDNKYPEKVSITVKNLKTNFISGGDYGPMADLVDIKVIK